MIESIFYGFHMKPNIQSIGRTATRWYCFWKTIYLFKSKEKPYKAATAVLIYILYSLKHRLYFKVVIYQIYQIANICEE